MCFLGPVTGSAKKARPTPNVYIGYLRISQHVTSDVCISIFEYSTTYGYTHTHLYIIYMRNIYQFDGIGIAFMMFAGQKIMLSESEKLSTLIM